MPSSKPPTIGQLNLPVAIQSKTVSQDDRGGTKFTWADVFKPVWLADNTKPYGTQGGDADLGIMRHYSWIRYRPGVVSGMRIAAPDGSFWIIQTVLNWEQNYTWLQIASVQAQPAVGDD